MLRVFYIDDESASRELMRANISQADPRFTLIGEAPDGEMALPMIRDLKPNVVITDMRMPFMNGLELCDSVRRDFPWIRLILLTGYDDMRYAREADALGIHKYLLKPVSPIELNDALIDLEASYPIAVRERIALLQQWSLVPTSERRKLERALSKHLTGLADASIQSIVLEGQFRCVLRFTLPSRESEDIVMGSLRWLEARSANMLYAARIADGPIAIALGHSPMEVEERAYRTAQMALGELAHTLGQEGAAQIGSYVDSTLKLAESYYQASEVAVTQTGEMPILAAYDRPHSSIGLHAYIHPLSELLQYAQADDVRAILSGYSGKVRAAMPELVAQAAAQIEREARGGVPCGTDWPPQQELDQQVEQLGRAIQIRNSLKPDHSKSLIAYARKYIAEQHQNSGLLLSHIAAKVGMANTRFAIMFEQETGITFTEYLAQMRIAHAKDLLAQTKSRVSNIAFTVGFSNSEYFAHLFTASAGMTPNEYRNLHAEKR